MEDIYIVAVHRDRYYKPKLTITIEGRATTKATARLFIANRLLAALDKKNFKNTRLPRINVLDYRIVDALGLKRLRAAAKASVTIRRKESAKKAAATRAANKKARSSPSPLGNAR